MIKVSVFLTTYNHAPYIATSIESALNQKTNFDYEILIGEDCSTDGTRDIVKHYEKLHPNKIRAIYHEKNVGGHHNVDTLIHAAKGQYLAWLEGDDYWTDPQKLQKQADVLDTHPEIMISTHNTDIVNEDGKFIRRMFHRKHPDRITTIKKLIMDNYIQTPSCMFRHGIADITPPWIHSLGLGDWPRHLLLAQHGHIHYMTDVMACYRHTSTGVWHSKDMPYKMKKMIEALTTFNHQTDYQYDNLVKRSLAGFESNLLIFTTCKTRVSRVLARTYQRMVFFIQDHVTFNKRDTQ